MNISTVARLFELGRTVDAAEEFGYPRIRGRAPMKSRMRGIAVLIVLSVLAVWMICRAVRQVREEHRDPPPTHARVHIACAFQEELWCTLALPEGSTRDEMRQCAIDYFPKCMRCLEAIESKYEKPGWRGLPDECQPLKRWRPEHAPGAAPTP